MKCEYCGKEIESGKYCSDACRQAAYRERQDKQTETTRLAVKKVEKRNKKEIVVQADFTPNWKRSGFASKGEAVEHLIDCLFENKKRIIGAGVTNEAVFQYGDYVIRVK